jgi:hypothetical protein
MLVGVEDDGVALLARDLHRHQLVGEAAGGVGGGPALLGAQGEGVLVGAADAEVGGHVVRGLRHRVGFVELLHRGLMKRQPMVVS